MASEENTLAFLTGKLLAEGTGVSPQQGTAFGSLLLTLGMTPADMLLVYMLAAQEGNALNDLVTSKDIQQILTKLAQVLQAAVDLQTTINDTQTAAVDARNKAQAAYRAANHAKQSVDRLEQTTESIRATLDNVEASIEVINKKLDDHVLGAIPEQLARIEYKLDTLTGPPTDRLES